MIDIPPSPLPLRPKSFTRALYTCISLGGLSDEGNRVIFLGLGQDGGLLAGVGWSSHWPQFHSLIRCFFINLWFYCLSLLPCIPEIGELTMLRAKTGHPLSALTVQVRRKASVISSENLA